MILNNYYNLKSFISNHSITGGSYKYMNIGLKDMNGNFVEHFVYDSYTTMGQQEAVRDCTINYNLMGMLKVLVGTGTTEPSMTDYSLASDITSTLVNNATNVACCATDSSMNTVIVSSFRNSSGSSITIREVGIMKTVRDFPGYGQAINKDVLLVRFLLDTPKVVKANESFTMQYIWAEG